MPRQLAFKAGFGHRASAILEEKPARVSTAAEATDAILRMRREFPVPEAELQQRVSRTATDNYIEISARFVVPVRSARTAKNQPARRGPNVPGRQFEGR